LGKSFRAVTMVTLSLVLLVGVVLAGCGGGGQDALVGADMDLYQYLKGTTGDMNDKTINSASEGGGEAGYKFGLAATVYPTYRYSAAALDAMANVVFAPPYQTLSVASQANATTFDMLTGGDQLSVNGAIFAYMPAAEQDMVSTAVAGFFNRHDNDLAAAKDPDETSAYEILAGRGAAAATAWATEVAAGGDYADRFFVNLVKGYVTSYPAAFAPYWLSVWGYATPPTSPTEAEIEAVARVAGESSFISGTAGTMYPTQAEALAQSMYSTAYADLAETEGPYVDAEVYANLPSAFGNVTANAAVIEGTRNGVAAGLKAYGMITHDTYATCTGVEKAAVDQALFATALPGPALEWDYITFAAVPGAIMGWGAEMADALALDKSYCYVVLNSSVGYSAAESWKADVTAGAHPRQAFYRWLSKEQVRQGASYGTLIQVCVNEFSFKITNPNDYLISVDNMNINFQIASSALADEVLVDAAKLAVGDKLWVPANDEVIVKLAAPTKTLDVITWLVMAGKSSNDGRALAGDVWSQISAGTAEWIVTVEATMSNETETITDTYDLTWVPTA